MTETAEAPAAARERLVTVPFLLVGLTTLVYFIYVGILIPVVPSLIEDGYGGSKFDIGLAMAVFSVVAIACRPILARLGERYGMRPVIISGALVALVATLLCTRADHLWTLLPLRCLQGIGEAFVFVGGATLSSLAAPPSRRAEAASYYSVAVFVGIGVGPLLSDPLVNRGKYDQAFLLGAGFVAVTAVLGALSPNSAKRAVPEPEVAAAAAPPPAVAAPPPKRRRIHPDAVRPGVILAVAIAAYTPFNAFMPAHAKAVGFHGAAAAFGLYSAICLAVRIIGARLPERAGLSRTVSVSLIGVGLGMAVFAAWPSRLGVVVGTTVMALGISLMYPALAGLATRKASDADQVRVMSAFTMFFEIGVVGGSLGFGVVGNIAGRRGAFAAAAICAALGWILARRRLADDA